MSPWLRLLARASLLGVAACASGAPAEAPPGAHQRAAALPQEVRAFVARRDTCDHFRGEEAYDAARAREIAKALAATCRHSDAELARLRHKYRRAPAVVAALAGYEDRIE